MYIVLEYIYKQLIFDRLYQKYKTSRFKPAYFIYNVAKFFECNRYRWIHLFL